MARAKIDGLKSKLEASKAAALHQKEKLARMREKYHALLELYNEAVEDAKEASDSSDSSSSSSSSDEDDNCTIM